jgi:hypothetical protein
MDGGQHDAGLDVADLAELLPTAYRPWSGSDHRELARMARQVAVTRA